MSLKFFLFWNKKVGIFTPIKKNRHIYLPPIIAKILVYFYYFAYTIFRHTEGVHSFALRIRSTIPVAPPYEIWATNLSYPDLFRGHLESKYSSKYHTFIPSISGDISETMSKKQGKIRFFQDRKTVGGTSRPRF